MNKLYLIICVAIYYAIYILTYELLLSPLQEFWGFGFNDIPYFYAILNWAMVLTTAYFCPTRIERPTQIFFIFQYVVIFIPLTIVAFHSNNPILKTTDAEMLIVVCWISLMVMLLGYKFPVIEISGLKIESRRLSSFLKVFGVLLLAYLLVSLSSNFKIANFEDIYDVRDATMSSIGKEGSLGAFAGYASMWLSSAVLPLIFSLAFADRNRRLIFLVSISYFILYGLFGAKSVLIALIFMPLVGIWSYYGGGRQVALFVVFLSSLLVLPFALELFDVSEDVLMWYVTIIQSRTISEPALLLVQYLDFFSSNPYTYWSHINVIGSIVDSPYETNIPYTVGWYYYGLPVGSNAGFWAQDGLASIGLVGIVIMSVIVSALFWLIDCITARHNIFMVVTSFSFITLTYTNASLFTTLWSGGLILMILYYWMSPVLVGKRRGVGR